MLADYLLLWYILCSPAYVEDQQGNSSSNLLNG
jgi:hypothetical protein